MPYVFLALGLSFAHQVLRIKLGDNLQVQYSLHFLIAQWHTLDIQISLSYG